MARGKYYSLEEARKDQDFKQFAKEHPSTGDRDLFDKLLEAMAKPKKPSKASRTSKKG